MTSSLLVALQLALIVAIAVPWEGRGIGVGAAAVVAAGGAIGAWALAVNRPGNFNIRPEPRPEGRLITTGPYRWIRHPMYAALLLAGSGLAAGYASLWRLVALVALAAVLAAKARREERGMAAAHPGYAAYTTRTKRIVPWLW